MIKTFEIDLDDALVENASEIFEALGTDIDTAIKMFLTQATLRQGFPFEVAIPQESENDSLHDGVSEEEEDALATATETPVEASPVPPVSPEIAARVAANEALVAQMREEIGDKDLTPEFDEGEEEKIQNAECEMHNDSESASPVEAEVASESDEMPSEPEKSPVTEPASELVDEDEEEDETTPDNLFDAWDVGEEEDIGCR
ncbi:hypothetical protein [Treponema sp. UBA3813]|uniref:type II toxin-antitoxin system RelB/DinJ family antitoxin n=1 Tax=Treponema sp. UBA3813 TaxID=1947715 RepID=UPI0025D23644|nr:hypothetical protein [Treponema sp. UBA3813]